MGTVTLGVSIAVPEPYGSLLQERRAGFGDPAAHGIPTHVTLLPPTEVGPRRCRPSRRTSPRSPRPGRPFPMRLSRHGHLPAAVAGGLRPGGRGRARPAPGSSSGSGTRPGPLVRELQFPYHPHVTVAHGIAEEAMDRAYEELAGYEAAWACTGFALYEQGADGVWRKLRDYPFGGGRSPGVPPQSRPRRPGPPRPLGRLPAQPAPGRRARTGAVLRPAAGGTAARGRCRSADITTPQRARHPHRLRAAAQPQLDGRGDRLRRRWPAAAAGSPAGHLRAGRTRGAPP